MAANTAFADFPRLGALHAGDGFLPRQLTYRGSRLVYSRGIVYVWQLSRPSSSLFFRPVSLVLSRCMRSAYFYPLHFHKRAWLAAGGRSVIWRKVWKLLSPAPLLKYEKGWQYRMLINGFGAVCTAVVMVVFAVTKFKEGAWVVLILTPVLVTIFFSIHHHYKRLAKKLSLDNFGVIPPHTMRHRVIMPVSGVHQGTLAALRYARMLSDDITAVHVTIEPADAEKVRQKWETWGEGVRMVMLDSPYRLFIEPILGYIAEVAKQRQPGETITIVVPEFVAENRLTEVLHTNTADLLRSQLRRQHGIVIINVPYHVHEEVGEH
jgi:hypothetical protein